jgi:beta-barrel assembly-enhancing protease
MSQPIEGGVFHPEIPTKRASATFDVSIDRDTITAETSNDQTFTFELDEAELELAGATGKMLFIKFDGGKITLFTEDPNILLILQQTILERQVLRIIEEQQRASRNGWMLWAGLLGGVIVVGLGLFASIQTLSHRLVGFIPIEADVTLGEYVGPQMSKEGPEVTDDAIVQPVQQIVDQITANIEEEWNFDVHVIDADIQNAYALPGGYIVVYTGLIADTERPEQLAGVLAHEIAHVTERHGMARILEAAGMALVVDMVIGNVEGMIAFGAELFSASAVNAYSRDAETDADVKGLRLLVDAGIDPTGMVEFFQIMEQEEDELTELIPLWMRSHPEHEERIVVLQANIGGLPLKDYEPLDMDWDAVKAAVE